MTVAPRPNFFLLLELNPDEPWDQTLYQRALQEKIRQWSRDSMSITKISLPAQANRALLPLIRQVMENPALRVKEGNDFRKLLATRYDAVDEHFETQLTLLNLKEVAESEEIELFIKEFKHIIPIQTIRERITLTIRTSNSGASAPSRLLDASVAKNIADRLAIIHMPTLYELLQSSRKSTTLELFQAAEKLYAHEVRQHRTAEVTARLELAGFAMSLFTTDEMRDRYDEMLCQTSLQRLLSDITETVKRSTVKEVYPQQVLYYLQKAEELGCSEEKALEKLKEHGRVHQWFITIPMREPSQFQSDIARNKPEEQIEFISSLPSSTTIENIYQLQYRILRSAIRLYWKWPRDCQAVYLSYGIGMDTVQHHAPDVTTRSISRTEYDKLGYYDIYGTWNQHYTVLISSLGVQNNIQTVASGIQIHLHFHKTMLTYEIQLPRLLHRKRTLHIVADTPGLVPPLVLISKSNGLPFEKTDGNYFHRIEEQVAKKGEVSIDLPVTFLPPQTFGKLFLEDERFYSTIIIHHPASQQLRLS